MLKNFWLVLIILYCGCSARHPNSPAPVTAAAVSLIPNGAATTVEDDSTDTTLNCAALSAFPVHGDTQEAFQNLTGATTAQRRAFLVGYGSPGTLCTGRSSQCNSVTTAMNLPDVDDWKNNVHLIQGKFSRLTVLGCNVGQFQDGADFVSRLAQESHTTVRAPTGLVWCQGTSLTVEPETEWVEAKPGKHAKPSTGPVHTVPVLDTYRLSLDGELRDVPVDATHVVQFQYVGSVPYGSGEIDQDQAKSLAKLLDLAHPFKQTARPLAALTARLQLSVAVKGKDVVVKRYLLYADAVLQDIDAKNLFYPVDTRLHERLQRLRLQSLKPEHH
jgi:hypothetical protein